MAIISVHFVHKNRPIILVFIQFSFQHVIVAQQQPVFVTIQSPAASVAQPQSGTGGYKKAAGISTGVIQIICGSLSIILGIASIFNSFLGIIGWPLWGGTVS